MLTTTICFFLCFELGSFDYEGLARFSPDEKYSTQEQKYLIYDVNPGEGFNLRRDVYMRIANTVRQLREKGKVFLLGFSKDF